MPFLTTFFLELGWPWVGEFVVFLVIFTGIYAFQPNRISGNYEHPIAPDPPLYNIVYRWNAILVLQLSSMHNLGPGSVNRVKRGGRRGRQSRGGRRDGGGWGEPARRSGRRSRHAMYVDTRDRRRKAGQEGEERGRRGKAEQSEAGT